MHKTGLRLKLSSMVFSHNLLSSTSIWSIAMDTHASEAAQATQAPSLLLVDDHALLRFGLCSLLSASDCQAQVSEASCLSDALDTYRDEGPFDLVLLDLNMADCRGLQGLRQFLQHFPAARVAVLSATSDDFVVQQAQALGAVAYLAKSKAPNLLAGDVQRLLTEIKTKAHSKPLMRVQRSASHRDRVAELGPRHVEILDHVLYGCSNQEISTATGLSLGTVKNYVSTILLAMDATSRSHLISVFR
jgi:DNA-binding NarL/FixJ family response regulator